MSKESKLLVFLQLSCLAYLVFSTKFINQGYLLFFQIFGFLICLWAVVVMKLGKFNIQPEVKLNANFVSKGPYRVIRNPMYLGLILFFAPGILNSFQLVNFSVFLALIIILLFKIRLEERFLEIYFGEIYLDYKNRTYRLIPYIF